MDLREAQIEIQRGLRKNLVLIAGPCAIKYKGRAGSKIGEGERLILIKRDGTFLVHQNTGFKPVNYQPPGTRISVKVENKEGEKLVLKARRREPRELIKVTMPEVHWVQNLELKDDEQIDVYGTERELADMLMDDLSVIEKGLKSKNKECPLPQGDIDIFAKDKEGNYVVIEVKRKKAGLKAVTQLKRYTDQVEKTKNAETRGILCAPGISDKAKNHLEKEDLEYSVLEFEIEDFDTASIKGLRKKQKGLTEFN